MRRLLLGPAIAGIAIAVSATPVLGLLVWTLTGGPLTVTAGTTTTFTLTATNLDALSELGCLEVDLPASFTLVGAQAGNASNGDDWEAVVFAGKVAVHSLSGGGRLELAESVTFTITAVPTAAGTYLWPNHAHRREDCAEAEEEAEEGEAGVALSVIVVAPVLATPAPTPHPTPAPTPPPPAPAPPAATPRPTVQATPAPTPRPTARPTPRQTATPAAEAASRTSSPSPTPTPSPSASPSATAVGAAAQPPPSASSGAARPPEPDARRFIAVARPNESDDGAFLALGPLGVIDGLGVWMIPGAVVGGPGLLVILWVAIQTGVAAAWIPAVRRLRGSDPASESWPPGQAA